MYANLPLDNVSFVFERRSMVRFVTNMIVLL
jgi:hypothetical protein